MDQKNPFWHIDDKTKAKAVLGEKKYSLLPASEEDKAKVVQFYGFCPVAGYDVASVEVIFNPSFNRAFVYELDRLQEKTGETVFAPKWDQMTGNEQRKAVIQQWKTFTAPYYDSKYPSVHLFPGWHGTRPEFLDSLFRIGYSSLSYTDNGFFGRGLYFAYEAEYSHRVYSKGALILNWVASFSPLPVIDGDMPLLQDKSNYGNYDAHFVPVVPQNPHNSNEKAYYPCKASQKATYHELVAFQTAACLPRYLVQLQKTLLPPPVSFRPDTPTSPNTTATTSASTQTSASVQTSATFATVSFSWETLMKLASGVAFNSQTQMLHLLFPVPAKAYWTTWQEKMTEIYRGLKQPDIEQLSHAKTPDDQIQIISVKATPALLALYRLESTAKADTFDLSTCIVLDKYMPSLYGALFTPDPNEKIYQQLVKAFQMNAQAKVTKLIQKNIPLLPYRDEKQNSFLHLLAQTKLTEWVGPFLQFGFRLTDINAYGDIPLHYACSQENWACDPEASMVVTLIQVGSPLDTANKQKQTPLMVAARCGHVEAVRQLLLAGADKSCADQHGQTAFMLAKASQLAEANTIIDLLDGTVALQKTEQNCVIS